jgi:hypothetical protein
MTGRCNHFVQLAKFRLSFMVEVDVEPAATSFHQTDKRQQSARKRDAGIADAAP